MDAFILILEIIGTIAFAVSGAMTGLKKRMDIFGVVILGVTTAVGGGVIRDVILGKTPPVAFISPLYAVVAVCTSIVIFFPVVRKLLSKSSRVYEMVMLIMDSIGLGVFSVMGVLIAYETVAEPGAFLLMFVGVITGVGGGVLRDIFAGNTPYIFVKHIYACASLTGVIGCVAFWEYIGEPYSMILGIVLIIVIRLLSAHFRWNLPKAKEC